MKNIAAKVLILGMGITLVLASPGYSQEWGLNANRQGAPATPINIIILKVTGPDDTLARASIIEGGALKIQDPQEGTTIAFFPVVNKNDNKTIIVTIRQVFKIDSEDQFKDIEKVEIALGASKSLHRIPKFTIEIEAIAKHLPNQGQPFKMPLGASGEAAKSNGNQLL
jgi:hypothetical protein